MVIALFLMISNEPPLKRAKIEIPDHSDFENFISEIEKETERFTNHKSFNDPKSSLEEQIEIELLKFGDENEFLDMLLQDHSVSSRGSPCTSTFEAEGHPSTSASSPEEDITVKKEPRDVRENSSTIATLKRAMRDSSRMIGTFTTLKTTYLKLCKEFNYLLGKFNENEKIKIELIHENNELRKLLVDVIKEKELDRKKYKDELKALRTPKSRQEHILA